MAQQHNQGGARGEDDRGMAQQQKQDEALGMPGRAGEGQQQQPMGDLGIGRDIGEEEATSAGGSIGTPGTTGPIDETELGDAGVRGGRDAGDLGAEAEGLSDIDEEEDVLGEAGLRDELEGEDEEELGGPL